MIKNLSIILLLALNASAQIFVQGPAFIGAAALQSGSGGGAAPSVDNTFRYVESWATNSDGAAGTLVLKTPGMAAGDLIFVTIKNEGSGITNTTVVGDVSGTYTNGTQGIVSTAVTRPAWMPVCSADTQITATFSSASATFRRVIASRWHSSTPALFDTQAIATGTSTAPNSGNITTAGAGLVIGYYGEFSSANLSGCMIDTNSGVNIPDIEPAFFCRQWGYQQPYANTVAAKCTMSGSGSWMCGVVSFKGSGADATTGTNYANFYQPYSNQTTNGGRLTLNIITNGSFGFPSIFTLTPASPTNLIIDRPTIAKQYPVRVGRTNYEIADATHSLSIINSTNPVFFNLQVNDHRQLTAAGTLYVGVTNTSATTPLFDIVRIETLAGHFVILQFNKNSGNANLETDPGGVTTHTTGFTLSRNTTNRWCMLVDFENAIAKWKMIDITGATLVDETASIHTTKADINNLKVGNVEFGTDPLTTNYIDHLMIDYMHVYPFFP